MYKQNRTVKLRRNDETLEGHLSKFEKDIYMFFPFQQSEIIPKPILIAKDGIGENEWIVEDWENVLNTKGVISE